MLYEVNNDEIDETEKHVKIKKNLNLSVMSVLDIKPVKENSSFPNFRLERSVFKFKLCLRFVFTSQARWLTY